MRRSTTASLRERKKALTRSTIQMEALRLFQEKGYEATTIGEIAAAAGVSSMTFFRYFPTKEDVVLWDEYDELFAAQTGAWRPDESEISRVQNAIKAGLALVYAANREELLLRTRLILQTPALRARMWEQQAATEQLIAHGLSGRHEHSMRTRVIAAACLGAMMVAIRVWAEEDGARELPDLVTEAFDGLRDELERDHGHRD